MREKTWTGKARWRLVGQDTIIYTARFTLISKLGEFFNKDGERACISSADIIKNDSTQIFTMSRRCDNSYS